MLPDAPLPIAAPDAFSPDIERELPPLLTKRLGREGTAEELQDYRQFLWAFAIALRALDRVDDVSPSDPPESPCPVPQSTPANPASPTTGRP